MLPVAESHIEEAGLAWLAELGYGTANGLDIGPDGDKPERASYGDVLLVEGLRAAIAKLTPTLNAETRAEVLARITQAATPSLVEENRRLHRYMVEGVPVDCSLTALPRVELSAFQSLAGFAACPDIPDGTHPGRPAHVPQLSGR